MYLIFKFFYTRLKMAYIQTVKNPKIATFFAAP